MHCVFPSFSLFSAHRNKIIIITYYIVDVLPIPIFGTCENVFNDRGPCSCWGGPHSTIEYWTIHHITSSILDIAKPPVFTVYTKCNVSTTGNNIAHRVLPIAYRFEVYLLHSQGKCSHTASSDILFISTKRIQFYKLDFSPLADDRNTISLPVDFLGNTSTREWRHTLDLAVSPVECSLFEHNKIQGSGIIVISI